MDERKEIIPTAVDPAPVGRLTPADLAKLSSVPRDLRPPYGADPTVIYVQQEGSPARPEYPGDDLLRRFLPYFVISLMGLIIIGGIGVIASLVIPPLMAVVITLVGSLVSIILSLVVTVITAVIVAMGITACQTINRREDRMERAMDLADRMDLE